MIGVRKTGQSSARHEVQAVFLGRERKEEEESRLMSKKQGDMEDGLM